MIKIRIPEKIFYLVILQVVVLFLSSCAEDKGLVGDRIPVFNDLSQENVNSPGKKIKITSPEFLKAWPQLLSGPSRAVINVKLTNNLEDFDSYRIIKAVSRDNVFAPIIVSDTIFYLDSRGAVHAQTIGGKHLWSTNINGNSKRLRQTFPGGLAYSEGLIYITSSMGKLSTLDAKDGEVLWEYDFDQPFRSFPLIYRKNIYVVTGDDLGVAFSRDGKLIWSFAGDTQANSISYSASPSAYKGRVFFPFSSGSLYTVDSINGSIFWKKTFSSAAIGEGSSLITDFGSSPILLKTGVLASSFAGQTILINFDGNIIWATDVGTSTSPLIVDSDAFFIDKNGFFIRLSLSDGKIIWSRKLLERSKGTKFFDPVLVNGNILLTKNDRIVSIYSPFDGALVKSKKLKGEVSASPISYKGELYFPLSNGKVQVF